MRRSMLSNLIALLLLSTLWPTLVLAENPRGIGIVATLTGQATVTRAALPQQSLPLKFRDELFYRDRISTKERSIVQVLLGSKALVTVRELSDLTITEEPAHPSIVDLAIGKLSLAVTRSRMSLGETVEVHTPNAVVGVRGTVLVVEFRRVLTTEFTDVYVLKGSVEVFPSGMHAAAVIVNAFQSVTVAGNQVGPIRSFSASEVGQIIQDLKPKYQHTETPDETREALREKEQARVLNLATALTSNGSGSGASPSITATNGPSGASPSITATTGPSGTSPSTTATTGPSGTSPSTTATTGPSGSSPSITATTQSGAPSALTTITRGGGPPARLIAGPRGK